MYICVCKAVRERHIRAAVGRGVVHLRDLTRELGVGTCCGKCVPAAREALMAALDSRAVRSAGANGEYASAAASL